MLNAPRWFADPFAARQLASWLLLSASAVLIVWAVVLLRRLGRPGPAAEGSPMLVLENTETLVTTGVYRYIRHPMYASLLLLAWGTLLKSVSFQTLALAGVATLALFATARLEEVEDVARFGQAYRDYMKRTRRFVPFLL